MSVRCQVFMTRLQSRKSAHSLCCEVEVNDSFSDQGNRINVEGARIDSGGFCSQGLRNVPSGIMSNAWVSKKANIEWYLPIPSWSKSRTCVQDCSCHVIIRHLTTSPGRIECKPDLLSASTWSQISPTVPVKVSVSLLSITRGMQGIAECSDRMLQMH